MYIEAEEAVEPENAHTSAPYLLTVPASIDAYIAMPNGDPAQGAEEDSQVDVEDVCAAPVEHATLQEDFPTVLIPSGSIHDQVDLRFGSSSTDIPSEDSDNIRYGWRGKRGREGSKWTASEYPHFCLVYGFTLPHTPMCPLTFYSLRPHPVPLTTSFCVSTLCVSICEFGG